MRKYIIGFVLVLIISAYFSAFIILPFEVFQFGYYCEIFPALDLIIVYYFATCRKIEIWQLFIIGFALDPFCGMQAGTNSLILIFSNFLLLYLGQSLSLRTYVTNLLVFIIYGFFVIFLRYIAISVTGPYEIDGYNIYFYFLTTIFSYPIIKVIIDKPLRIFYKHVG